MEENYFPEHHESHAASAFLLRPFPEAAFSHHRRRGEMDTTSYGIGKINQIDILSEMSLPPPGTSVIRHLPLHGL